MTNDNVGEAEKIVRDLIEGRRTSLTPYFQSIQKQHDELREFYKCEYASKSRIRRIRDYVRWHTIDRLNNWLHRNCY